MDRIIAIFFYMSPVAMLSLGDKGQPTNIENRMTTNVKNAYSDLVEKLEEISRLGGVMSTLHWDQEVIMPSGAAESRAKQISALAGVIHERSTDPKLGECLSALNEKDPSDFNEFEACNIREAQREYDKETKVPKKLVQEMAELGSRGHFVWIKAREDNKFSDFAPTLERFIDFKPDPGVQFPPFGPPKKAFVHGGDTHFLRVDRAQDGVDESHAFSD